MKARSRFFAFYGKILKMKNNKPFIDPHGPRRLAKRLSELNLCSRREGEEYILRGWVLVDGVVVKEVSTKVTPEQDVTLSPEAQNKQSRRVTILLNKPIGYVSGLPEDGYEPAVKLITDDNRDRRFPGEPLKRSYFEGMAPAGRLDIDSQGLIVFTQDGRVAKTLVGEDGHIEKEYLVRVRGQLTTQQLKLLNHGLELDGKALKPAQVDWINDDQLRFVLTEGKKRQIRRMCESVHLEVVGLKRVRIGNIMLGNLVEGCWRYLEESESF